MFIAVNYHYIRDDFRTPYPGIFGVTPAEFEHQLRVLADLGEFVSGDQVACAVRGDRPLPNRAILITFDDGLREQYVRAVPILERLGIPAMFFTNTQPLHTTTVSTVHQIHLLRAYSAPDALLNRIYTEAEKQSVQLLEVSYDAVVAEQYPYDDPPSACLKYMLNFVLSPHQTSALIGACFEAVFPDGGASVSHELYMDRAQLHDLAARGWLGTHGHDHLPFGQLPSEVVHQQVRFSVYLLELWTGRAPIAMSYPFGNPSACSRALGKAAADCGIHYAFTMERAANFSCLHPHFLARFDCNDLPGDRDGKVTVESFFNALKPSTWVEERKIS